MKQHERKVGWPGVGLGGWAGKRMGDGDLDWIADHDAHGAYDGRGKRMDCKSRAKRWGLNEWTGNC